MFLYIGPDRTFSYRMAPIKTICYCFLCQNKKQDWTWLDMYLFCLCFWQNTLGPIGGNQCQKISWWVVLLPLFWRIFWIFLSDIYGFVMMTSTTKEQTKFRTLHQRSSLSLTQVFQSSPLWEEIKNGHYTAHRAVVRSVSSTLFYTLLYSALLCFTLLYSA